MSVVRWESDAELRAELARAPIPVADRALVARLRAAVRAGQPITVSEVGGVSWWAPDGETCLGALSPRRNLGHYAEARAIEAQAGLASAALRPWDGGAPS